MRLAMFKAAWQWVAGWFRPRDAIVIDLPSNVVPFPTPKPTKQKHDLISGAALLKHVDAYFETLRSLRREHGSAFGSMMKAGGFITASYMDRHDTELNVLWRRGARPTFGACFWAPDSFKENFDAKTDFLLPSMGVFEKQTRDGSYALSPGVTYRIVQVWPSDNGDWVTEFYVSILHDGQIVPVRQRVRTYQQIHGGNNPIRVAHVSYGYDPEMRAHHLKNSAEKPSYRERFPTFESMMIRTAAMLFNAYVDESTGLVARVVDRSGLAGNFVVPMEHVAKAFPPGHRDSAGRRIFHMVRVHQRASGSFVRAHFRGERFFRFGRYSVEVFLPGLHKRSTFFDFDVDVLEDRGPKPGTIAADEAIDRMIAEGVL